MEISKLTICRQDLIIVSDTDTESKEVNSCKKKKHKIRTKCIRNVKLTTMTVNRIVPYCYRERCQNGQHYHRQTSMNTKYRKKHTTHREMKYKNSDATTKNTSCNLVKIDNDMNITLTRDVYSPITIASSSDTYENISSPSFIDQSSDSDEIEDLINLTRKRMKSDGKNFNTFSMRKSVCETTTQEDYQNISSNDDVLNSSLHSMDTVVLYDGDTYHPTSPEHPKQLNLKWNNNNTIDPMLSNKPCNPNTKGFLQKNSPSLSNNNNNNLSPIYEISGKVLMEHYLNTNII